jgi:hypothetical protein
MEIAPKVLRELQASLGVDGVKTKILSQLAVYEKDITSYIESLSLRDAVNRMLLLLVTTGNSLIFLQKEGGMKVYKLDQYVVRRDAKGDVVEIIVKESICKNDIPVGMSVDTGKDTTKGDDEVELFTEIKLKDNKYYISQSIKGVIVPKSEGDYPKDSCPWKALTWNRGVGDNYGRGHVEAYLGDFISLEALSKAMVEGAAAAAKVIFLVNPNGTTRKNDLIKTPNTGFAPGNPDDVKVLQVEKYHDFKVAYDTMAKIEERLSYAFLLHSSVQRSAERVTAEEIRYMAQELEDALGGIYSLLSQEFQMPLVNLIISQMKSLSKLPTLPKEIKPVITTGLEALGRGHDLTKLNAFTQQISVLGPDVMMKYLNVSNFISRVGTSIGIDTDELIKTEDMIAQEQEQQQQMAMASQAMTSGAGTQVAKGMMESMNQQEPQE